MRKQLLLMVPLVVLLMVSASFADHQAITPSQVEANIQNRLYRAHIFKHGQVQVEVVNGTATLTGTVNSFGTKMDAQRAVVKAADGMRIENDLDVQTSNISTQQILARARQDIVTYYAYTIFDGITLEAEGNALVVKGQVTQPYKKSDIGNILGHIQGVSELKNELQVLPLSNFDDHLRISIARAIYRDPYFVHYAVQALPPIHIIVDNGNVTLEGVVLTKMDKIKAEMAARMAAPSFTFTNNLRVEQS